MLHCEHCDTSVLDMRSMPKELSKPDGSMCECCEDDKADMLDFCDAICHEGGRQNVSEFVGYITPLPYN